MKRLWHPRFRQAVKWTCAPTAPCVALFYIFNLWWSFNWIDASGCVEITIRGGGLCVSRPPGGMVRGFWIGERSDDWLWVPWWYDHPQDGMEIPLWLPLAFTAIPAARMFRNDVRVRRRGRLGHCLRCGYDRAGLAPDAACPECGAGS